MKTMTGKIVSTGKMEKTVVVEIESFRPHPLYKKIIRRSKRILVHNGAIEVKVNDLVKIGEIRPLSKKVNFKILSVEKKA